MTGVLFLSNSFVSLLEVPDSLLDIMNLDRINSLKLLIKNTFF